MALPGVLQRIVDWLRAGYPEGVPDQDYVPLFALLASHLTEDEVRNAIEAMPELAHGTDPSEAVAQAIGQMRATPPSPGDVARVRAHLESVGWDFERGPLDASA